MRCRESQLRGFVAELLAVINDPADWDGARESLIEAERLGLLDDDELVAEMEAQSSAV